MKSKVFGKDIEKIKPVIISGGSDSAAIDNVLELFVLAGRSLPHAMMMLIPAAWENNNLMDRKLQDFYKFHICFSEPWDGPASIPFTDGHCIGAVLDRNGLRPSRYTVTKDGFVVMASETGVLDIDPANVLHKGRLEPGRMFLVDIDQGRIVDDEEIKNDICRRKPYRRWLKEKLLVLLWFLIFWGIFLFFYAGSYTYGADVRFALLGFMPLAVLAGLGCGYARDRLVFSGLLAGEKGRTKLFSFLLIGIILASFLQFFPLVRRIGQEAWGARYDHQYAEEFSKKIPERSIVLTHNPAMFLLWNRNAIQAYAGINNPEIIGHLMKKYRGHVYFHYNYWCNAESAPSRKLCRAIKDQYFLEEIACEREQNYEYVLYKMEMKR